MTRIAAGLGLIAWLAVLVWADSAPAQTLFSGEFKQGGFVFGRTIPGARVVYNKQRLTVSPDGVFAFGFDLQHKGIAKLEIFHKSGPIEVVRQKVKGHQYRLHHLQKVGPGITGSLAPPSPAELGRSQQFKSLIANARRFNTPETWYATSWTWPVSGPIQRHYATYRIKKGKIQGPYRGIDIEVPQGTPVKAPADGIVRLANADPRHGAVVIIDHGHGVSSDFSNMETVSVAPGGNIAQGDVIGTVGAIQQSAKPHLRWGVSWRRIRLNPALIAGPMSDR